MKLIYLNYNNEKCNSNLDYFEIKNTKDLNNIKTIDTEYIMFYKNTSNIDNINFDEITNYMKENNINLYALMPYTSTNKKGLKTKKSSIINIEDGIFNLYLDTYIIKKELLNNYKIDKDFERFLIADLLVKEKQYYQSTEYKIIKNEDLIIDKNTFNKHNNIDWYISDLKLLIEKVKGKELSYQNIILNYYLAKLYHNIRQIESSILNSNQLKEFEKLSNEFLNNIDDSLLNASNITKNLSLPRNIIYYILKIKYNSLNLSLKENEIYNKNNDINYLSASIKIITINYEDDYLYFDCQMDKSSFDLSKVKLLINDKEYNYEITEIYAGYKIFGKEYYNDTIIKFKVKLEEVKNIKFININNDKLQIYFSSNVSSRLVNKCNSSYWNVSNKYLKCNGKQISVNNIKLFTTFINEIKFFIKELIKKKKRVIKPAIIKTLFFLTRPFYKNKNIYVSYDKLYKGGDCGEYIFRYLNDNTKENAYYIINKDTYTYKKLKKDYKNRLLIFGSLKCRIVCLNAKYILSTDSEAASFCSFTKYLRDYIKGYFNAHILHIQHGVTMQHMYHRQQRTFDNHELYFVCSKYERKNLMDPKYGYDESQLIYTGLARFDGLKDKSENIILISPTWRVDVANVAENGKVRPYNKNFKNTNYYKVYNGLINNKKLIDLAKKNNYKIIYIIHPTLITNIDDFDKNECVEIIPSNKIDYEDYLTRCKIMVTDYSGIQYDFAYMHKSIVYYHNDDLHPSYNNGMMDYENIGFGPISKTEEEVVNEIEKIIKNNGKVSSKYDKRISDFFKFNDYNNCKRVYEEIKKRYNKK